MEAEKQPFQVGRCRMVSEASGATARVRLGVAVWLGFLVEVSCWWERGGELGFVVFVPWCLRGGVVVCSWKVPRHLSTLRFWGCVVLCCVLDVRDVVFNFVLFVILLPYGPVCDGLGNR